MSLRRNTMGWSALLLGFGAGCIQVDAELPTTCFLQNGVSIEALGVDEVRVQAGFDAVRDAGIELPEVLPLVAVETSFRRDGLDQIPDALDELGADATVSLLAVDVTATEGLTSFEIIDEVAVTMAPAGPETGLPPTVLARCRRDEGCDVSGATVILAGAPDTNLVDYMRAGELEFTLELAGRPPLETWTFDVDVCMSGGASYEYEL